MVYLSASGLGNWGSSGVLLLGDEAGGEDAGARLLGLAGDGGDGAVSVRAGGGHWDGDDSCSADDDI